MAADGGQGADGAPNARCPRCGAAFHCGVNDAAPCACGTLTLGRACAADLVRRYQGCLCLACLRALADAPA